MKRGGFLQRKTLLHTKTRIRVAGHSDTAEVKRNIQALLRLLAIQRDGGCVLRHYPEAGACAGYRNDGELILQAEHLHGRQHSVSFADMRNIVLLCRHHHGHFKPEEPLLYWSLIRRHIGEQRWAWLQRVIGDNRPYPMRLGDWLAAEIALTAELASIQQAKGA